MIIKKRWTFPLVSLLIFLLFGCGELRFSHVEPEAKDFHPKRIGIFPANIGPNEEAKGIIEQVIADVLIEKKWVTDVVTADTINKHIQSNEELRKVYTDYISKLRAVSFSDPELSKRLGEITKVDAFLLANVDYWIYTTENDNKVAKVGMGIRMVDASSGKILWKASHIEAEEYMLTLMKPKLPNVAKDVVKKIIKEMPH